MGAPVAIAADPTEMVFAYFDQNEVSVRSVSDRKAMFSDGLAQKAIRVDGQGAFKAFFSPDGALLFSVNAWWLAVSDRRRNSKVLGLDAHAPHTSDLRRPFAVNYKGKSVSTAAEGCYDNIQSAELSRHGKQTAEGTGRRQFPRHPVLNPAKLGRRCFRHRNETGTPPPIGNTGVTSVAEW
ncbi:MAG TPA: hypothetical protein VI320_25525 [Terracidiphilus sp.]|jgi:hypothetical protein